MEVWSLLFCVRVDAVHLDNGRALGQISGDNDLSKTISKYCLRDKTFDIPEQSSTPVFPEPYDQRA